MPEAIPDLPEKQEAPKRLRKESVPPPTPPERHLRLVTDHDEAAAKRAAKDEQTRKGIEAVIKAGYMSLEDVPEVDPMDVRPDDPSVEAAYRRKHGKQWPETEQLMRTATPEMVSEAKRRNEVSRAEAREREVDAAAAEAARKAYEAARMKGQEDLAMKAVEELEEQQHLENLGAPAPAKKPSFWERVKGFLKS